MAQLTTQQKQPILHDTVQYLGRNRTHPPGGRPTVIALINAIDQELEAGEGNLATRIPAGEIRDWALANLPIVRDVIIRTSRRRREVL